MDTFSHHFNSISWALPVLVVVFVFTGGCKSDSNSAVTSENKDKRVQKQTMGESDEANPYSSFGVKLQSKTPFRVISFKDVGMERANMSPTAAVLETIAQSLAFELRRSSLATARTHYIHDQSLADPNEHKYCEKNHLYVDLWQSRAPKRWGYSLWSGCSKHTRFSKREVRVDRFAKPPSPGEIQPLTSEIVDSLEKADRQDCFKRSC